MKVLLTHKFHRLTGGAEVFYFDVARVLKKYGHQVGYFSTSHEDNVVTGDFERFVPPPRYESGGLMVRIAGSRDIFYSSSNRDAMLKAIDDFQPDVLHAFAVHVHLTPSIFEAAKMRGVPVIVSCNDYKHICPNYKLYHSGHHCEDCKGGRFYNAVKNKCSKDSLIFSTASAIEAYTHEYFNVYERYVDRFLFASEYMLNKTKEFWADKDIDYGILKNPFDASAYSAFYRGDYAFYFGRIVDEKGVDRILDAARRFKLPIKIVGDGPELGELKLRAESEGLSHVEFLGPMWGDDLVKLLEGCRFVVVPSLWNENFPYVIFQAFAAGKPVIGSLRGGIPELVGDERGLLFDPDNVEELADCMKRLWEGEDECKRMGMKAHEYVVREFSNDVFYDSLMSNYKEVLL
jgi:glycosyltransferase involved in cell wall biosynthesis